MWSGYVFGFLVLGRWYCSCCVERGMAYLIEGEYRCCIEGDGEGLGMVRGGSGWQRAVCGGLVDFLDGRVVKCEGRGGEGR